MPSKGVKVRINPILWGIDEARAGKDDKVVVTHEPTEISEEELALFDGLTERVVRHENGELVSDELVPLVVKA